VDVEQVLNLLEVDETIKNSSNAEHCKIQKGNIEFKNVSFTYDSKLDKSERRTILDNVSFSVPAG
jgi:ABC-type transport system involved in Fe-S cluster assembly fused permease/ATPase subunit